MAYQETAVTLPGIVCPKAKSSFLSRAQLKNSEVLWSRVSAALIVACSVAYFFATVQISRKSPLWMDEVMASWLSQLPGLKSIWFALLHGTMSSPPVYFYVLKAIRFAGGNSNLALRLPSIAGGYLVGLAVFFVARRYLALPFAALAMVLSLETGIFVYATQVREYTLVTACFALAVLLWDTPSAKPFAAWRVLSITLLLAGCVSLHFYGLLLVVAFACMELLWSLVNGRIRARLWLGICVAGGSVLAWYPLMRYIMSFTSKDASSPKFFAPPTIAHLLTAYGDVAFGGKGLSLYCALLMVMAALFFWAKVTGWPLLADRVEVKESRQPRPGNVAGERFEAEETGRSANYEIIVLATAAVPFIVFLFALVVTKTFNERYAIAGCIGFAMLTASLISYLRVGAAISCALLAGSVVLLAMAPKHATPADPYGAQSLARTGDSDPIVVGEGLVFLELEAGGSPDLRSRLVYLTTPPSEVNPDTTNDGLVKRWHQFRPDLNIQDPGAFLRSHSHFYLLHTSESADVITPWLMRAGRLKVKGTSTDEKDNKDTWLFEVLPESLQ
jgi:hypothetical protein